MNGDRLASERVVGRAHRVWWPCVRHGSVLRRADLPVRRERELQRPDACRRTEVGRGCRRVVTDPDVVHEDDDGEHDAEDDGAPDEDLLLEAPLLLAGLLFVVLLGVPVLDVLVNRVHG